MPAMEALRLKMETWTACIPVVSDWHYFDEEQYPDPDLHQSEKKGYGSASRLCGSRNTGFKRYFGSGFSLSSVLGSDHCVRSDVPEPEPSLFLGFPEFKLN